MAECEVKIVKTDLGEKLNIGHGKKKVSAGMVAWSPDGQHILTTTCAPRLRMSNGLKVWHYSSTLLHETLYKDPTNLGPGKNTFFLNFCHLVIIT